MSRQGLDIPVLLGGAALTRNYVEDDCVARLRLRPRRLCARCVRRAAPDGQGHRQRVRRLSRRRPGQARGQGAQHHAHAGPGGCARLRARWMSKAVQARRRRLNADVPAPHPALLGRRSHRGRAEGDGAVHQRALACTSSSGASASRADRWRISSAGRGRSCGPVMRRMLDICEAEHILQPQAVYGYWKAAGQGNDLILFEEDGVTELARFTLPRQPKRGWRVHRRFLPRRRRRERDVIGLQVVTMGQTRLRGRARLVRGQPLPGLSLSARAVGGDGRGDGGIRAQAHPRRAGLRRRG